MAEGSRWAEVLMLPQVSKCPLLWLKTIRKALKGGVGEGGSTKMIYISPSGCVEQEQQHLFFMRTSKQLIKLKTIESFVHVRGQMRKPT